MSEARPNPREPADRATAGDADPARHEAGDTPAELRRTAEQVAVEAARHLLTLPRPWDAVRGDGTAYGDPPEAAATDPSATSAALAADASGGVATKSSPTDVVTASDEAVETLIRSRLGRLRPGDPVFGEEQGGTAADAGPSGIGWVVDPIDGTVNFLYGLPWYAVSVAAVRDGRSVAGAVVEPATGRVWSAAVGAGATCDGRPLRVSGASRVELSLLATGFGYDARRRARQAALVAALLPRVRDVRRTGSAALDLCAVAAGWLDAYLEHGCNWWDWAAAGLIAAEAGAVVRVPGPPGTPAPDDGLGADALFAATPGVADGIAALAREHGAAQV